MTEINLEKIYTDDMNVPYRTTKCTAIYTKSEIDGVLAKFGIKKSGWNWEPEANDVYIIFHIKETINGLNIEVPVRIDCFLVWNKGVRGRAETVNWAISMRTMYWFIKSLLEAAYLKGSSKTAAFLPYIVSGDMKTTLSDKVIPRLGNLDETLALADKSQSGIKMINENEVIDVESTTT